MSELKQRIEAAVEDAMRARARERLSTLRMITAAVKQREIDERIELDDVQVLAVLDKMVKQRREAADQYRQAGRHDLADQESAENEILGEFLPAPLDDADIDALVRETIMECGASSLRDLGQVMKTLQPRLQGRADMGAVSGKVRNALS